MLSPQLVRLIVSAAICCSLMLALAPTLKPNTIEVSARTQQDERKLDDEIPTHVPLRAKITKEKEKHFKDLKNEKWARDLELEVTNVGDKPVYEFYLMLIIDVKAANGYRILFPVYYGRTELGDIRTKARADDVPIKPGESVVLKIHPGTMSGLEKLRHGENLPHPKRIRVVFQFLNFGDGNGYSGSEGGSLPRKVAGN